MNLSAAPTGPAMKQEPIVDAEQSLSDFESLLNTVRSGKAAEAATELPQRGAFAAFSTVVECDAEKFWDLRTNMEPGTPLTEGVHEVRLGRSIEGVAVEGSFFIGVGCDAPKEQYVFTDATGVVAAPAWATGLPVSVTVTSVDNAELQSQKERLVSQGQYALNDLLLMWLPAAHHYTSRRARGLTATFDYDDAVAVLQAETLRGLLRFASAERPDTSFGHWAYLALRKKLNASLSRDEGVSVETSTIQLFVKNEAAAGRVYTDALQVSQAMGVYNLRNKLSSQNPGLNEVALDALVDEHIREHGQPESRFSLTHIARALEEQPRLASLDEEFGDGERTRHEFVANRSDTSLEEVEMRSLFEDMCRKAELSPLEKAVFAERTGVLANGEEAPWSEVAVLLGLDEAFKSVETTHELARGVFLVAQAKLRGEEPPQASADVMGRIAKARKRLARKVEATLGCDVDVYEGQLALFVA